MSVGQNNTKKSMIIMPSFRNERVIFIKMK